MVLDRLTWIGFTIVAAGWVLLLLGPQINDVAAHAGGRPLEASPFVNLPAIAQCAILSGFGVGVIGALQTGFGALNRFFMAVLARSGQTRAQTAATSPAYSMAQSSAAANYRSPAPPQSAPKAIPRPAQPRKIMERGWVKDRAYVLFVDGSVEVDTMLGRRMFPSLQEAQEFIA